MKNQMYKKTNESESIILEFTPLCWGVGFEIGYIYKYCLSLWIGPIYIGLSFGEDEE